MAHLLRIERDLRRLHRLLAFGHGRAVSLGLLYCCSALLPSVLEVGVVPPNLERELKFGPSLPLLCGLQLIPEDALALFLQCQKGSGKVGERFLS